MCVVVDKRYPSQFGNLFLSDGFLHSAVWQEIAGDEGYVASDGRVFGNGMVGREIALFVEKIGF